VLKDDSIKLFHRLSVAELVTSEGKHTAKKDRLELYASMVHVFHTFPMFALRDEAFARVALWMSSITDPSLNYKVDSVDGLAGSIVIHDQNVVSSIESDATTSSTLASSSYLDNDKGENFFSLLSIINDCGVERVKEEKVNLDTII
jgi:hypothetical protein